MQTRTNRQWILKRRPEGMVDPSLFELVESPVPDLADRQILAQTLYVSFDPTQRAWMESVSHGKHLYSNSFKAS